MESYRALGEENYKFLRERCPHLLKELKGFSDHLSDIFEKVTLGRRGAANESCLSRVLLLVALPQASFLWPCLLLGGIPNAYYTLRTILEAIGLAVYADIAEEYRSLSLNSKIEELRETSLLKITSALSPVLKKVYPEEVCEEIVESIREVYGELSSLVHPFAIAGLGGILKANLQALRGEGRLPPYGPRPPLYEEGDLKDLKRLYDCLMKVKEIINYLIEAWSKLSLEA